jgi:hypothetical protein
VKLFQPGSHQFQLFFLPYRFFLFFSFSIETKNEFSGKIVAITSCHTNSPGGRRKVG